MHGCMKKGDGRRETEDGSVGYDWVIECMIAWMHDGLNGGLIELVLQLVDKMLLFKHFKVDG